MSTSLGVTDIIGIAVGGVMALVTVIGCIIGICSACCKKKDPPQVAPHPYPPYGGYGQQMNTGYHSQPYPYPQHQQQHQQQAWDKPPGINEPPPPSYSAVYPGSNSYGKT